MVFGGAMVSSFDACVVVVCAAGRGGVGVVGRWKVII